MDGEMEGIRGRRGNGGDGSESDEEESRDVEGDVSSEDTSRGGNEDDEGLDDDEYTSEDDSLDSDDSNDEEDHLEAGDCEDKEDRIAFGATDMHKDDYFYLVLPMKRNDGQRTLFYLEAKEHMPNEAWARLGEFIDRNTHLREIRIIGCKLTGEKLALLFGSEPLNNNSIEILRLDDNPMIGSGGVTALKPFFKSASSLTILDVTATNLGPEGIKLLSLELDGLPNLNNLILRDNNIGDEGLEGISVLCFSKLTRLHLGGNLIGRRGCGVSANLLRSDESNLELLNLQKNDIDDTCAEILARSLVRNNTLEVLDLTGNDNISCVGWESFGRLVCDTSSVSATYGSNHTLREINSSPSIQPITLKCALADNGRPGTLKDKACRKIIKHHFGEGNNVGPLLDTDVKLMPHVFSWITQRSDEDFGVGCRKHFMYQILRTSNVFLCAERHCADDIGGGGRGRENPRTLERKNDELGSDDDQPFQRPRLD